MIRELIRQLFPVYPLLKKYLESASAQLAVSLALPQSSLGGG